MFSRWNANMSGARMKRPESKGAIWAGGGRGQSTHVPGEPHLIWAMWAVLKSNITEEIPTPPGSCESVCTLLRSVYTFLLASCSHSGCTLYLRNFPNTLRPHPQRFIWFGKVLKWQFLLLPGITGLSTTLQEWSYAENI